MPTYNVIAPEGRLSAEQKSKIAVGITRTHNEVTNAPLYFAQVIFYEIKPGNYFVGGTPLTGDQVFVHGNIRSGRSPADKRTLLTKLVTVVANAASTTENHVWVYIAELPPAQMAEFGHVLPEPGGEAAWTEALPKADRERMQAIGIKQPQQD
jgi:phenylpyruvate tautomerase PptA (4-oxalocrotonate tautomerase family)